MFSELRIFYELQTFKRKGLNLTLVCGKLFISIRKTAILFTSGYMRFLI